MRNKKSKILEQDHEIFRLKTEITRLRHDAIYLNTYIEKMEGKNEKLEKLIDFYNEKQWDCDQQALEWKAKYFAVIRNLK